MNQEKDWIVYLLECGDKTFYCGITKDVNNRVAVHNKGKGAKYTKGRRPVTLLGFRVGLTHSEALHVEYEIKKLPRKRKVEYLTFGCFK